uniref:protein-tyrosine-phosphatase n=1 Tax=Cyprinus carpio TaxID=7962 RepID=A0A8C1INF2_CYPCA
MTARFRLPAGRSYDVGALEEARERQHAQVVCNVLLLDNTVQTFRVNKQDQGRILLDIVYKHLELTEQDYFGLQLADDSSDSQRWLDPNKPIRKQLKRLSPHNLRFRVKFFVSDPSKLQEEYTRYSLGLFCFGFFTFLHICCAGLPCPQNTAVLLASYSVQAELGDYNHSEHLPGYLSEYSFIPNPPQDFEKEVTKLHQEHNGLTAAQSEFNYLNAAWTLELYGVELHYARVSDRPILPHRLPLPFSYVLRTITRGLNYTENRESLLGFNMMNYRACKNLWKACVEHHTFFRLERPVPPERNLFLQYFTLGSKSPSKPLVRRLMSGLDWETFTHTHIYIYIYVCICICVCVCLLLKYLYKCMYFKMHVLIYVNKSLLHPQGGADQRMPIIVSRVAPGTPADMCMPRLNEGDQVVLINGRDISEHTHDDVVMLIKASCEDQSGELILLVRPNGMIRLNGEKLDLEPDFQYIPEISGLEQCHSEADSLRSSIQLLRDGLSSGTVLAQFDQLYRKRPGMSMSCARLPQNVSKNRYRDISPYDTTRVVLKGTDDYINANFINMEVPGKCEVKRYIACQGPLPGTCSDFWQMVWEQSAALVVMLTTQVERGRVKCHQYWPNVSSSGTYGGFQVTCVSEEGNSAYLLRDLTLTHLEVTHLFTCFIFLMQYMAWPDHGVPDDSSDFLNFVSQVRSKRTDASEPVVVHCSAGIGRTGVLITMETAMCLIENGQSVYPLDIVRTMRDQRAMMIQTPSQYRFVCEAILKVYDEELVKPFETEPPVEKEE